MKEIKNWDKVKRGQIVIEIYSDGSGLLAPQLFHGIKKGYPLLSDIFDEGSEPSLANIIDTKFYEPDKWYWEFYKWHLLDLKSAYSRYYEMEKKLANEYDKVCEFVRITKPSKLNKGKEKK